MYVRVKIAKNYEEFGNLKSVEDTCDNLEAKCTLCSTLALVTLVSV